MMTARIRDLNIVEEPKKKKAGRPKMIKPLRTISSLDQVPSEVKEYRRIPLVVKAVQLPFDALVVTLRGEIHAQKGDMVILDERDCLYPCDKGIFDIRHESGKEILCRDCGKSITAFKGMIEYVTELCFECFRKDDPAPVKTKEAVFKK